MVAVPKPRKGQTMTDLSKSQLSTILSALDGEQRNPNTKDAALKAIAKHGERLGLTVDDILSAAGGLLDGRQNAEEWLSGLGGETDHDAPETADVAPTRQSDAGGDQDLPTSTGGEAETKKRPIRPNTKQAAMIELLRRPEGATVEQIAEVTGWQNHTVRGAIAGALKKKLGLVITTERVRSVGPNKDGARGSYTIYRITDAA
jgi:hypothetical protein